MDLNQVKLVYLSACETGAGQLSASEGLVSLARSFAFAGVEQMVISQWVSEDRVSAYLSGRFYSHLKAGESPSQSLRLAKLELLADRDMVQFHHPYYWANFKLIGQPSEATDQLKTFLGLWDWCFWSWYGSGTMGMVSSVAIRDFFLSRFRSVRSIFLSESIPFSMISGALITFRMGKLRSQGPVNKLRGNQHLPLSIAKREG